jgi:hypothetical protein
MHHHDVPVGTPPKIFESVEQLPAKSRVVHRDVAMSKSSWRHQFVHLGRDLPCSHAGSKVFDPSEI